MKITNQYIENGIPFSELRVGSVFTTNGFNPEEGVFIKIHTVYDIKGDESYNAINLINGEAVNYFLDVKVTLYETELILK